MVALIARRGSARLDRFDAEHDRQRGIFHSFSGIFSMPEP
jgi:hypothetical protein